MNNTPHARNAEHAAALENYRLAQAELNAWTNLERNSGGVRMAWANRPEYVALVDARDAAKAAVPLADPKVPTPKAKGKK